MTVKEAKKKKCFGSIRHGINIKGKKVDISTNCIADSCIAWEWDEFKGKAIEVKSKTEGHCKLI